MPPRSPIWILAAAALVACCGGAFAQTPSTKEFEARPIIRKPATEGKVWGALVFASNADGKAAKSEAEPPKGLENLSARLGKVFSYSRFDILGHHTQDIFREYESWVVPSKDLFLKIDSKGRAKNGGINLHLQFWQEQQVLVKTDAVLRDGSPLFIGGPKWRDGRLIFVLMLTRDEEP